MAKLVTVMIELPEIETETDPECGIPEAIWVDGINYADRSAAEFVVAAYGARAFQRKVQDTHDQRGYWGDD